MLANISIAQEYVPSPEVLKSREQFADDRFGIFIHWGIYSMFGQGNGISIMDRRLRNI